MRKAVTVKHDALIQLHQLGPDDGEEESAFQTRGEAHTNERSTISGLVRYGTHRLRRMFTRDSRNPSLSPSVKQGSSKSSQRHSGPVELSRQGTSAKQQWKPAPEEETQRHLLPPPEFDSEPADSPIPSSSSQGRKYSQSTPAQELRAALLAHYR